MNTSTQNNDRFHFSYLNIKDFIQFAQGNVGTIWLGKLFQSADILLTIFNASNTNTRKGIVDDVLVWKQFSHSYFAPNYNIAAWHSGLYKLKEFSLLLSTMSDPKFNHLDSEDSIKVVTAYLPRLVNESLWMVFIEQLHLKLQSGIPREIILRRSRYGNVMEDWFIRYSPLNLVIF